MGNKYGVVITNNAELKLENDKIIFKELEIGFINEKGIIYVDHKLLKDIVTGIVKEELIK